MFQRSVRGDTPSPTSRPDLYEFNLVSIPADLVPHGRRDTCRMGSGLVVPELPAGPFRLRPFLDTDVDLVRAAAHDPYIPLITTVPAVFTGGEGPRFIERQWSRAEQRTGYSFAIAEATTDQAAGQVGLWLRAVSQGRPGGGDGGSSPSPATGAAGHPGLAHHPAA